MRDMKFICKDFTPQITINNNFCICDIIRGVNIDYFIIHPFWNDELYL